MLRKLHLALLAPLLIVGCATRADDTIQLDAGAQGVAALRAAPERAVDAGTLRFEMAIEVSDGTEGISFSATGAVDTAGERLAMQLDMGSALAALGPGDDLPAGMDEPMELVVDGTTTYLRIPFLEPLTGTAGWLSASVDDLATTGDAFGFGAGTVDPSQILEVLQSVADDVETIGSEEVRGVATTGYRATVDLGAALEGLPPEQREELEGLGGAAGAGDLPPVPVEVWVDDDGLARRIRLDLGALGAPMGFGGEAAVTLELFDYGEPVTIEVPDPADVTPMTEALGGLGGFGSFQPDAEEG